MVVEEHFVQGFGGIPECTLLLAKSLEKCHEVSVDVLSKEGLVRGVSRLDWLPESNADAFVEAQELNLKQYNGVLITGSWNPLSIRISIRARLSKLPLSYAPKGNLCRIEFTRPRDIKKIPYLCLFEVIPLALAARIVFESTLERDTCVLPEWFVRNRSVIIPEPFRWPTEELPALVDSSQALPEDDIRFGFLAEISPRKGLKELVEGFLLWSARQETAGAQLIVAGEPRPGSFSYVASIKEMISKHSQGDRIIWRGPQRGTMRSAFYRELDFFVCPSRFESFGLTPIEALSQGTPVLCNSALGCLEFLPPSTAIGRFDLDPEAIAEALDNACQRMDRAKRAAASYPNRISLEFQGAELAERFHRALLS